MKEKIYNIYNTKEMIIKYLVKKATKILFVFQIVTMAVFQGSIYAEPALDGISSMSYNPLGGPSYPINQNSYFTDDYGNILMYINVIGEVLRQGQIIVRENVDFANVIAIAGGITDEANLKKVIVIRSEPEKNGKQVYVINIKPFYKKGDKRNFIALKPNDTIIIPEKGISFVKIARAITMTYPMFTLYDMISE